MSEEINQSNYIEWVKLAQRSYVVSYICAFIILSHVLTMDSATPKDILSLPIFGVSFPRLPAVLFTLLLHFMSGVFLLVSYKKLNDLSRTLPLETIVALKNYPSVGNSSWKVEACIVLVLYLVFLMVFINSAVEKPLCKSAGLALVIIGLHVLAFGYKHIYINIQKRY